MGMLFTLNLSAYNSCDVDTELLYAFLITPHLSPTVLVLSSSLDTIQKSVLR